MQLTIAKTADQAVSETVSTRTIHWLDVIVADAALDLLQEGMSEEQVAACPVRRVLNALIGPDSAAGEYVEIRRVVGPHPIPSGVPHF